MFIFEDKKNQNKKNLHKKSAFYVKKIVRQLAVSLRPYSFPSPDRSGFGFIKRHHTYDANLKK